MTCYGNFSKQSVLFYCHGSIAGRLRKVLFHNKRKPRAKINVFTMYLLFFIFKKFVIYKVRIQYFIRILSKELLFFSMYVHVSELKLKGSKLLWIYCYVHTYMLYQQQHWCHFHKFMSFKANVPKSHTICLYHQYVRV